MTAIKRLWRALKLRFVDVDRITAQAAILDDPPGFHGRWMAALDLVVFDDDDDDVLDQLHCAAYSDRTLRFVKAQSEGDYHATRPPGPMRRLLTRLD